jgi:hypothetical protein
MNPNEASANKSYNITQNGNTFIPVPANPSGKLVLVRIVINTKGGASNTIQIFDSTPALGTDPQLKKGVIDTPNTFGSIDYGLPFFNGIFLVVGGGTAPDVTVVYKEI